jgi:hypothetical protein
MALNLCSENHYGKTYPFQPTANQTQSNPIFRPKVAPPAKRQQRTWNTASLPGIIPKIILIALHRPSFIRADLEEALGN